VCSSDLIAYGEQDAAHASARELLERSVPRAGAAGTSGADAAPDHSRER